MKYKEGDILEAFVIEDTPFAVRIRLPDGSTFNLRETNLEAGCKPRPEPGEKILTVVTKVIPEYPWYLIGARQKQIETYGSGNIIHFETRAGSLKQLQDRNSKAHGVGYKIGEIIEAKVETISGFVTLIVMPDGETTWMPTKCFDGDPPPNGSTFEAVVLRIRNDGRCELSARKSDIDGKKQ